MPTPTAYNFTQQIDYSDTLIYDIQQSSISIALDYITTSGSGSSMSVSIGFKDVLSTDDINTLNTVMSNYTNIPLSLSVKFQNITGNSTTIIKSGSGILYRIIINNNNTGGTIKIYDNTAGSGKIIATLVVGSPAGGLLSSSGQQGPVTLGSMDLPFSIGLTIVMSGSSSNNITICYQ